MQKISYKGLAWLSCAVSGAILVAVPVQSAFAQSDETDDLGIAPFVSAQRLFDSNPLNRPSSSTDTSPKSDQVDVLEAGAKINFSLSRQRFSGRLAVSDVKYHRFSSRDIQGQSVEMGWKGEIGRLWTGALNGLSIVDQAPVQAGQVSIVKRTREGGNGRLSWNFHPQYKAVAEFSQVDTRFSGLMNANDPSLAGLARNDSSQALGFFYQPGTGSKIGVNVRQSEGDFPIRQSLPGGGTVSNNFDQRDIEVLGTWRLSGLTEFDFSVSNVKRTHVELPVRDFSGKNYRFELRYQPTTTMTFGVQLARQLIGISDVTNSDALSRQLVLFAKKAFTSKVSMSLNYRPQRLSFNGTDGFSSSPRVERLKGVSVALEYKASKHFTLGSTLAHRGRSSSLPSIDYSANSLNVFGKYAF